VDSILKHVRALTEELRKAVGTMVLRNSWMPIRHHERFNAALSEAHFEREMYR
jgi:hypothetical protein